MTLHDAPHALAMISPGPLYACLLARPREAVRSPDPLLGLARDFSPRVMRVGPDEILIDVSGLGRLIGEPPAIAAELKRALIEMAIDGDPAVAPTQATARLLVRNRTGRADDLRALATTDDPAAALAPLPVTLLQDVETVASALNVRDRARPYETFERWGIKTLGALAALPAADLLSRLGRRGQALHRLARGVDLHPFVPDRETPRFLERLELDWPIDNLEPLSFILARLLDPLSLALERADRGAAAVHLALRLTDRATHLRVLQLPVAMRDARVLRTLMLLDLESHPPSAAIDVVSLELDPAPARITQFSLLERALPSPETLSTLTARLSALVGETRCGAAGLVDTHQPGAFEMRMFEIVAVAADAERGLRADGVVLRRQRPPPAIRVQIAAGRPGHLAAARRGLPGGAVVQSAGPWRTSGGWWKNETRMRGSPEEHRWDRDEWDVELTDGAVCRIFQDCPTGRWFLEGVYD
jgi:protein ImuB